MKKLIILGAGTAGTMMANHLARRLPDGWGITIIDRDDVHIYQPGLLFLPFGGYRPEELVKSRRRFMPEGVDLRLEGIDRVDPDAQKVYLVGGEALDYDLLLVATGTRIEPKETEGLADEGWLKSAFDFYTLEGSSALAHTLESWKGGRLVVNFASLPIKCPVAPLEFAFLAEDFFAKKGMRDKVEIVFATPLDGAFTKPVASKALGGIFESRGIKVETDFALAKVDGGAKVMESFDGRKLDYDLLVTVPVHYGSEALEGSDLVDPFGFVETDKHTLQSKRYANVFAIGDGTNLPTSKAGSVAHFQADVLIENMLAYVGGRPLPERFDGHANCYVETGRGKALLLDFNYETEPLTGRFPLPGVGPFSLLEESYVNHWGKLAFKYIYWNTLLRGKPLPIDHAMNKAGKWGAS